LRSFSDDLSELLQDFALLVDEQLRIADHVDEQDVRNLQVAVGFQLSGHALRGSILSLQCQGGDRLSRAYENGQSHAREAF
jgi:hypothetical protein